VASRSAQPVPAPSQSLADDRAAERPGDRAPQGERVAQLVAEARDTDDAALARRIRAGDRAAFDTAVERYYAPLCEFVAGYVGSDAEAEECVQDVLFALWMRHGKFELRNTLRQYLYGAVRNAALNMCRHERVVAEWTRRAAGEDEMRAMGVGPAPTDDGVRMAELNAAAALAIAALRPRRREAYLLRFQHHLSHAEIAALMGISVKGVETTIARALADLREALTPLL
jgi:RNA polymerase sigma-70 factor, ECF subfamily